MKTYILRNTYAAIAALFIALFALPQQTRAQTKYDLWIAGTQVTSANCNNLATISGVSGTVKYDPANKVLTLQKAVINSDDANAINSNTNGLTIKVVGKNTLTTKGNATLCFWQPGTITGGGVLNLKSETDCAIYAAGTNLTIDNCTVNAESGAWGIAGYSGSSEKLTIKNATVTAIGTKKGSIRDFAELNLIGCDITQPTGAKFDEDKHCVVQNGEIVKSWVVISKKTVTTFYDLWIAGTQVTSTNCNDLTTIKGVSGTVKYDPAKKILTLQGATIDCNIANPIYSHIDGLTIKVIGTNKLITAGRASLYFTQPLTITGGGVLNAKSERDCGIFANRTHLTIDNCTVNAEGGDYGIAGNDGSSEKLIIQNATVTAVGTKKGSICDLAELNLIGCSITEPTGATFDPSKHGVVLNGEFVNSKVVIAKTYDLKIAGVEVTSANWSNLAIINGVSGTVRYDPVSKTLTLYKATIKSEYSCIKHAIEGLTIKVEGECKLETNVKSSDVYSAVEIKGNTTIKGDGILELECMGNDFLTGIHIGSAKTLTIEDCRVRAYAHLLEAYSNEAPCGIRGVTGSRLKVKKATVRACGYSQNDMTDWGHAIKDIDALDMEDCYITNPAGAKFDASRKGVTFNGELLSDVTIATHYDLMIAGEWLTPANCDNLGKIDGVSGTVKYDPAKKVLTLENATIDRNFAAAISSGIDGLTIKVIGTNKLITADRTSLSFTQPLTITGGGVLNAKSECRNAIYAYRTHLTIDNCTVNAEGGYYGIAANHGSSEKLIIQNATVTAIGTSGGSIRGFAELNLIGCSITEPTGATFDSSKHGVVLNGELVKSKVVIKKTSTAIEAPTADNKAKQGIYTIGGVKLNGEVKDLPKGIYIVNGKKVVKK